MILNAVRLYLSTDEYESELCSAFLFRCCYLSNFLTRHVRALRFKADGFRGILVQGRHVGDAPAWVTTESNVIVPVPFDEARYASLGPGEQHEFFVGMLGEGLEKCARDYTIPIASLRDAIEEFRRGGYRNEWTQQRKVFRPVGLEASLLCRLDTERFVLTLRLARKGEVVFERAILETLPDELIFAYRFKDIVLDGGTLVVANKFGKPTHILDLASLDASARA